MRGVCEPKPRHAARNDKSRGLAKGNRCERSSRIGAPTAIEWRSVREILTAVVRSTLLEARAVALTPVHGETRTPVTGEARTWPRERGAAATSGARQRTRARRCREGGEPMLMASTDGATITVEPVSGGAARGYDTHPILSAVV